MRHSRLPIRCSTPSRPSRRRWLALLLIPLFCLALNPTAGAYVARTSQIVGMATGQLGTVGTSEGWNGPSGNVTVTSGSGSLDGTALGLVPSDGDKADISASTGHNTYNKFAEAGTFPPTRSTNVYYSFLYRFNNAADVDPAGEPIVQVSRQNGASPYTVRAWARSVGDRLQIGVAKTNGTIAYAPLLIPVNTTVFVVLRHQIIAGGDDIADLWVNPPANTLGLDEANVPPPDGTATDGSEDTSNTGPGRFYVESGANASFDELRIATTWAEVTPSPNLCNSAVIFESPTNVTLTAGVNTTLSVLADGTGPTYRWQISRDGGQTWANATEGSGMTTPAYTTPNLWLTDNGVQYRCVVTVACNGSTATSEVATVTVLPPVPTPLGVVLEDGWDDLDRTTGPVSPSNSVWFASSTGSLIFIGDALYGQPASGSSRLWIGYFTDDTETNLPVHLDVGKSLKLTWVWNSTQIVPTGGNLRLGLFDYADGGTRVTGDNFGSGSTGNGINVRGYVLTMDYAQTFSTDAPFSLRARTVLSSPNLLGSTGDFPVTLASGPTNQLNAPGFQDLTNYTLVLTVTRKAQNSVEVSATISGGGSEWTLSGTDNTYAYHRFDAFAIRPNSLETTAFDFEFVQFKVEVVEAPPQPIPLQIARAGSNVVLSWSDPRFTLQAAPTATGPYTNVAGATSPYTAPVSGAARFFRLSTN